LPPARAFRARKRITQEWGVRISTSGIPLGLGCAVGGLRWCSPDQRVVRA
jgi:hypothetical protein